MNNKVIGGKRKCGKTTELIKKSSKEGLHIVCSNIDMARHVSRLAKDMNIEIPEPVAVQDIHSIRGLLGRDVKGLLIDEVQMVLRKVLGFPVYGMSTSFELEELPSLCDNNTNQSTNLLTIKLQDESSVPKVFYKGEEVTKKVDVNFDWTTATDEPGRLSYGITNYDFVKGKHVLNKLQRECDSHE